MYWWNINTFIFYNTCLRPTLRMIQAVIKHYFEGLEYLHFFAALYFYPTTFTGGRVYFYSLVSLRIWINNMKYTNQVLNQTLVPPGVNSQATLQYTKSLQLAAPLPALRTLSWSIIIKHIIYIILKWTNLHNEYFCFWFFEYILMPILLYIYLSNVLITGLIVFLVVLLLLNYSTRSEYFFHLWTFWLQGMGIKPLTLWLVDAHFPPEPQQPHICIKTQE